MKKIAVLLLTILTQACAFTDATLDVKHNDSASFVGPISEIESLSFKKPSLTDDREDKARIGWKKNGYGQKTADIMTQNSVQSIVSNGISAGLKQNGHNAPANNPEIIITGSVKKFWFETDVNFWTVEFIGEVQCDLKFIHETTGQEIYSSSYQGTYSEKVGGGLNKTWQRIMSVAVDKLVEDITFDEDLAEALEEFQQSSE